MAPPSQPPTVALELRDVSKAFGSVIALRSSSLTLQRGSIHALVGENGAGKSTLVKDGTVLLGDPYKFNKDNIGDFDF